MILALDEAWVGVVGVAVGGFFGFVGSWLVHRGERTERLEERSRAERKDGYSGFLTSAEDSVHRFQRLAEGHFTGAGRDVDRTTAIFLYDQEVTPRYMVLKIIGGREVLPSAEVLREAVNALRHLVTDDADIPDAGGNAFRTALDRYRSARDFFIHAAQADLGVS